MTSRWCQYLQVIPKIKNSLLGQRSLNTLPGFSQEFNIAGYFISCFYFFYTVIALYIQPTPDNMNPCQLKPCANLEPKSISPDLVHPFTVILPSITLTLDNSNLLLTQRNFFLPSDHFQIILPSKTRTMFWSLKKSGKKQCAVVRNIDFEFPTDML